MSKAKRNALAVLFTAVALFMFAALLCLGFPMEAKAENKTHQVGSQQELSEVIGKAESGEVVSGDTVQLTNDIALTLGNQHINGLPKKFTIDVNGHTLTLTSQSTMCCVEVAEGASLTVTSSEEGGKLTGGCNGSVFFTCAKSSTLTLRDITVDCTSGPAAVNSNGTVVLDNVDFNGKTGVYNPAGTGAAVQYYVRTAEELAERLGGAAGEDGSVTLSGDADATITYANSPAGLTYAGSSDIKLYLSGYEFSGNFTWQPETDARLDIYGGSAQVPEGQGTLAGVVNAGAGELYVNGTTLTEAGALNVTKSSAEVTLESGTFAGNIVGNSGKLYVNGGTYTGRIEATKTSATVTLVNGTFAGEVVGSGGNVAVNGGTFTGTISKTNASGSVKIYGGKFKAESMIDVEKGTFSVYGGAFVNTIDVAAGTYYIYGGTFESGVNFAGEKMPKVSISAQYAPPQFANGIAKEAFSLDATSYEWVEGESHYTVRAIMYFAVNGTEYKTLKDALDAAEEGGTVTLLRDIKGNSRYAIEKSVTLDLGGHTVDSENKDGAFTVGKYNDAIEVTIQKGTVVAKTVAEEVVDEETGTTTVNENANGAINVTNKATLTLKNVSVEGGYFGVRVGSADKNSSSGVGHLIVEEGTKICSAADAKGLAAIGVYGRGGTAASAEEQRAAGEAYQSTVTVAGGEAVGYYYGISNNGTDEISNTKVTVTGGTVKNLAENDGAAIFNPGRGEVVVSGGVIEGATGIEMRAGKLAVEGEGVAIEATAAFQEKANGSGSTLLGVAVGISQHMTDAPIGVTLNGGTYTAAEEGYAFYATDLQNENVQGIEASIEGGTYNGAVAVADVVADTVKNFVKGGTFSEALPAEYLAAECAQMSADGTFTVGTAESLVAEKKAVAMNAETAVAYASLQEAVNAADAGETVKLLCNVTADAEIKVAQGQDIVLDLNGKTLTNAAGSHTVTNYGTLTIVGQGTVTNVSGSCGALVNYGEATLLGGTFTRTKDENENWYIIKNYGAMTIGEEGQEGSVTVESELTAGAALITNGYFDAADRSDHSGLAPAAENACTLTIYGGTFSGGAITLKNDDLGKATIAGGSFTNGGEVAIQNSYQMTITGGSFEQTNSAGRTLVATSVKYAAEASTTISGGTFTSAGYVVANGLNNPNNSYPATAAMDISGGTFRTTSSTASAVYVFTGGNLTVTGGEFYGGSGRGYGINFGGGAGTTLAVSGADTYIEASNGIYVLTAEATVELADATVKATNRSLYFSRSDSITVTSGEYTGEVYMIPGSDTQASISGGTFNGAITVNTSNAELTGFISGGMFKQQPAAEYMDPGYAAEYRDGFYVPVESSALYIAQKEAQADIRAYAASLGIAWDDVVAAADPENASPYQAEAEPVMNAYNAIAAAASERQVADAKLEAMGALDVLCGAIKDAEQKAEAELAEIKQGYITELQTLAKGSETLAEVVVPTATYLAINNAETAEEAELYYNNAVKEIEDIRAYRTAIAGQADQLTELAETLAALNTSLFGTEGEGGAFNGLLGDIEKAIKDAQNAIVNGAAGEEGTTSASLAGIQDYLEKTIKAALDGITNTLKGATEDLTAIKVSIEGLDVSGQLAEDFQAVLDKIAAAQGAITGATEEGAGVSIADAVEQINEVNKATAAVVTGLREALVGTDGISGKLDSLATTVGALQGLLKDRDSGLEAIVARIDAAKDAILGTASVDGGSASGLQAVLEAVNGVDKVTDQVLAEVQGLANTENGVAAQIKGELDAMLEAIEGLTGKLATSDAVAGVKDDIADAQAEIDKIVAAIGSLGTAEGNDLAAKIEQVVGSLAAVQGTVGSIAESVNASTTVEAVKGDAMTDIAAWLNGYLDEILGTAGDAGSGVAVVRAFTAETTAGDIYAKLAQAFSEDNAKLVLKYYNDALAAIDAATTVSEVTTAVSTFKAQVASVEAAAQNVTDVDLTGVYVLLAILVVAVAVVIVVMILKRRQQPAQQAAVQEAAPVQAQAAPEPVTREVAVTDDDKEQVVIAANVRSFSEAYVDLSQELRELFNKVRAYALGKENAVEVRQSTGVCVKRNGKQIVKLTVRRNAPVALFFLENEMLKDFRRESGSQSKLKVHATELILREEADLAAAYKMVDLSIEQIDKDIAAKKERAKELRRLRRQQKAEQSKKDGAES